MIYRPYDNKRKGGKNKEKSHDKHSLIGFQQPVLQHIQRPGVKLAYIPVWCLCVCANWGGKALPSNADVVTKRTYKSPAFPPLLKYAGQTKPPLLGPKRQPFRQPHVSPTPDNSHQRCQGLAGGIQKHEKPSNGN